MKTTLLRLALALLLGWAWPLTDARRRRPARPCDRRRVAEDAGPPVRQPAHHARPRRSGDAARAASRAGRRHRPRFRIDAARADAGALRAQALPADRRQSFAARRHVHLHAGERTRGHRHTRARGGLHVDARRGRAERRLAVHGPALCQGGGRLLGSLWHGAGLRRVRAARTHQDGRVGRAAANRCWRS